LRRKEDDLIRNRHTVLAQLIIHYSLFKMIEIGEV
jgi:hypothetical protein